MTTPKKFVKSKPFDPRLVTKTSLPNPKEAIALLVLLWLSNNRPANLVYGETDSDGTLSMDQDNLEKIQEQLATFTKENFQWNDIKEVIANNPLLTSQLESLKAAFELVWRLGIVNFEDNSRSNSAERKGGKRYPKRIQFASNMDVVAAYADVKPEEFTRILLNWLSGNVESVDKQYEEGFTKILAAFAEISLYKTGKGEESTVYVPAGVYDTILNNDGKAELTDAGSEIQGPTRIFNSLIKQGLNPYLKKGGNSSVEMSDSVTESQLQAYCERAQTTMELSFIEVKAQETMGGSRGLNNEIDRPRNLIFFGAPGTGKSYTLNQEAERYFDETNTRRVTFHPDYTYAQFVGSYKPVPVLDDDDNPTNDIKYDFVPGPFLKTYVKAIQNPNENFLLIVEEINRANPAGVFGDIFQLLDRDANGESDYAIAVPEDMRLYLQVRVPEFRTNGNMNGPKEFVEEEIRLKKATEELKIPSNMYIWATMNSADQGVYPMDTAFKRRWSFRYMDIDGGEDQIEEYILPLGNTGHKVKWNDMRKAINKVLQNARINEDKFLGPFFIDPDLIDNGDSFVDAFKSKVLLYLIEDAAKTKKEKVFGDSSITYSVVSSKFDDEGENIFSGIETLSYVDETDTSEEEEEPEEDLEQ